jgi:hypothetical protein
VEEEYTLTTWTDYGDVTVHEDENKTTFVEIKPFNMIIRYSEDRKNLEIIFKGAENNTIALDGNTTLAVNGSLVLASSGYMQLMTKGQSMHLDTIDNSLFFNSKNSPLLEHLKELSKEVEKVDEEHEKHDCHLIKELEGVCKSLEKRLTLLERAGSS